MKQQLMTLLLGAASVFCSCETQLEQHVKSELRAPAYPLVSIDPYTSACAGSVWENRAISRTIMVFSTSEISSSIPYA